MTGRASLYALFPFPALFRSEDVLHAVVVQRLNHNLRTGHLASSGFVSCIGVHQSLPVLCPLSGCRLSMFRAIKKAPLRSLVSSRDRKSTRLNSSHVKISYAV